MKKLLLVLVAIMGLTYAASAQDSGRAIGVRLGSGTGSGAEFSFQQLIGSNNRIELDAGYSTGQYLNFAAAYHWRFPIAGEFNWFIGPALNLGYCINHGLGLSAGVQGGAEWNPENLPLQISLDGRPLYDFLMDPNCAYKGFYYGVALGVRYKLH